MQRCIELAQRGLGNVAPNPMVGCVIVHEEKIIGEGYHEEYGKAHAEVNAINSVENKSLLKRSTLYVNLEPCSHYGKTPPCAELITYHKIPYVVIGCKDSNELVKGKGIEKLIKGGTDVKIGILEEECRELNKRFFIFHEQKRPYVILKWAQTADDFIARNASEKAEWISNIASKKLAHQWRSEEQAILVGTNTVMKDDPQLTVREHKGKNPLRIFIDKNLKIPAHYRLLDNSAPTLIFNSKKNSKEDLNEFIQIDLTENTEEQILNILFKKNISSLIIEGGTLLLNSFIKKNLWDEARIFTSHKKFSSGIFAPSLSANSILKENNFIESDNLKIFYRGRE